MFHIRPINSIPAAARVVLLTAISMLVLSCSTIPWASDHYTVTLEGIDDKTLNKELLSLSEAWQNRNDRSIDTALLAREFRADNFNMERYLHAKGYSRAVVTASTVTNKGRPGIVFRVSETNRYILHEVHIEYAGPAPANPPTMTNSLSGQPVDFAAIDRYGRQMVRRLRNDGYPEARIEDKAVLIDHEQQTADASYRIRSGNAAVMGDITVVGLRTIQPDFVDRRVTWKPGDPYRQDALDTFSRRLTESALFSFVDISGTTNTASPGVYDVTLRLQERRRRTVGLGVGYQSDTGAEVSMFWQHRNLFGMGEKIEIDATYGEEIWLGSIVFTWTDFLRTGHDFDLGLEAADEESDAYDVQYERIYGRVRQRINRDLGVSYGPALRYASVEQLEETENYVQVSLPVAALWNKRDDNLDPTKGYAINASAEPFYDLDSSDAFFKTMVTPSVYVPLSRETLTFGARLTLGSISGQGINDVPADQRYYAGGGQSIRGYAYQSVGPREDGQPIGGLSLVESSFELRWRTTRQLGFVLFVDGGSAYEPEISDFNESYQWGAGLGFRYFTGVGPIRVDFGVPINPRDDIDNNFEFYISIGQAF